MFLLTFVVALLSLIWFYFSQKRKWQILRLVPSPPGELPIIGHVHLLPTGPDLVNLLSSWRDLFPKLFVFWLGTRPNVLVYHPDTVEVILKSTRNITKSSYYNFLHPWLSLGLLTSTGEKWKKRRHLLTPTFHFNVLSGYFPIFQEQGEIMIQKLEQRVGQQFNIFPYITHCALDIICKAAMGVSVDAQTHEDSDYVNAVYDASELVWNRILTPWNWLDFVYKLTPQGRKFERAKRILHGFTQSVIQSRREEKQKGVEGEASNSSSSSSKRKYMAFLDMLLETKDENGNGLTDADIQEEVDTFMFEGHDTTAAGMVWTIYLLGRHPEILKKTQKELDEVLGDSPAPTLQNIGDLKYLENVVKESLRLFPSVPLLGRELEEDTILEGYTIPRGTEVAVSSFLLHRNSQVWEKPDDFIPERFEQESNKSPFAYVPFSAGSRNCIGQKFALYEEKMLLSMILKRFDVEALHEAFGSPDLILRPKNGVTVVLKNRQK